MEAVVAERLNKRFGRTVALRDVSLTIHEGEIFGLLGPNGAGKTTLISILVGLTTPDKGEAMVVGKSVLRERAAVQHAVNMVRGFSGVLEKFTARELLNYYALLYDVPAGRVDEVLRALGLWEKRDGEVSLFSSGWRQRFFIAKALLNKPRVLFLDEPTVGLDVDAAIEVRGLIKRLNAEGYTILLTTHYLREAEELCHRIALISDGRIVALGTAAELKRRVKREEAIIVKGTLDAALRERLARVPGVLGLALHGGSCRLLVDSKRIMKPVLRVLSEAEAHAESVSIEEPTLEDVFLKLTKKGLEDEYE